MVKRHPLAVVLAFTAVLLFPRLATLAQEAASGAFATLCSLEPGDYDDSVQMTGRAKRLLGKIVVVADSGGRFTPAGSG